MGSEDDSQVADLAVEFVMIRHPLQRGWWRADRRVANTNLQAAYPVSSSNPRPFKGVTQQGKSATAPSFAALGVQRVRLARALVDSPQLLLLDEPTTGLDPSVQADLLEVVARVTESLGSATVIVSHDLAAVRILASRVVVLHHGRIVEQGITEQVLEDPQHSYTQLLVSSRLT